MTKRTIDERSPSPLEEWEAGPRMPDIDGGAATSERNNGAAAGGSLLRSAVYFGSPTSNNNSPEPQGQFFEELLPEPKGPTEERKKESQVEKIMRFRRQLDEEKEKERLEKLEESLRKRKADDKEYDRRKLLAKEALQVNPPSSPESGFSIAPPILPGRFWGNRQHTADEVGVEPDGHHERDEDFTVLLTKLNEKENAAARLRYMEKKRKAEGDEEKDGNQKDPHQGNGGDKDPGHGNGGGSSSKGNGGYQRGAGGGYSQGR